MLVSPKLTLTVYSTKAPDIGAVANDGYSDDSSPTLQVTFPGATVGQFINFYNGSQLIGSIKLTEGDIHRGYVDFTAKEVDGTYDFKSTLTDTNPDIGSPTVIASSNSSVDYIDTQRPIISNILIDGGVTLSGAEANAGFTVTGSVYDEFHQAIVGQPVTVDLMSGHTVIDTATGTVAANGTWSVTFSGDASSLRNGIDSVTATVTDKAGNVSEPAKQYFDYMACFMSGTMVRGPHGEVAVENLKIGDSVMTYDGRVTPVRWVGRQTVSLFFADPLRVLPIRIKAGALGDNVPCRDLLLSPDHAVLVDGLLVQAGALVNGDSIIRESNMPRSFTYYHVELHDHALILAENTPSETFIDNIDRMAFDNWSEHEALYADAAPLVEMSYPRAKSHRQVPQATRRRLAERGATMVDHPRITAA
jgi:hypothetical protein